MHNEGEVSKVVNTQAEIGDWNKKCELKLKKKSIKQGISPKKSHKNQRVKKFVFL